MTLQNWVRVQPHELAQARRVLREPAFALPVIVMLGLAIGMNAAAFGAANRFLRGPAHVRDRAHLARIVLTIQPPARPVRQYGTFGYPMYEVFRDRVKAFEDVAAFVGEGQITLGRGADAQLLNMGPATASLFSVLGARPQIGRFFSPDEDDPDRPSRVAVLGDATWRSAFGASRDVIGTAITLNGEPYTVVGVAPRGFSGPDLRRVDVWVPLSVRGQAASRDWRTSHEVMSLSIVARLRNSATVERATAEAVAVHRQGYTGTNPVIARGAVGLAALQTDRDGREPLEATVARWLLALAILVVALAFASITNLVLARTAHRRRDFAVRASLGADRAAIIRLLAVEGITVALMGLVVALGVAYAVGGLLRGLLPDVDWATSTVDVRVFGLAACLTLITGLALGAIPAVFGDRFDIVAALKNTGRGDAPRLARLRTTLMATQSALATVLLVAALLFLRSLENLRAIDLGIEPGGTTVIAIRRATSPADPQEARREAARRNDFFQRAVEALRAIPGVEHAAVAKGLPFRFGFSQKLRVPGWDSLPIANMREHPDINAVSDDYFETVGTPLVRGRTFSSADRAGSEPVAMVNVSMARRLWPGRDPIGSCLYTGDKLDDAPCARIVGVVADAKQLELREEPLMSYYVPFGQERGMNGGTFLVARFCADCASAVADVRRVLTSLDPSILYVDVRTLQTFINPQLRPWQLGATMFGLMGVLALAMAVFGLYSIVSYLVSRRVREMGIRIALGARARHVVSLVLKGSVGTTVGGVIVGIGTVLVAGRFVEPLLFEVTPYDSAILLVVALVLPAAAGVAGLVPARRASRVDPARTLREE